VSTANRRGYSFRGEKKRVKGFLRNSGAEREKGMAGEERAHASVSWLSLI